jgi:hypothetical protein
MILPNVYLPNTCYEQASTSGIDSPEACLDPIYYQAYPHTVSYRGNSRGFRDAEWPDNLVRAVWCLGDSFTRGVGVPFEHTWPQVLQQRTGCRTINISMDGASNNWIARQAQMIIKDIAPEHMVIHWSYIHRREAPIGNILNQAWQDFYQAIKDPAWPDCPTLDHMTQLPATIQQEIQQNLSYATWTQAVDADHARRLHYIDSTVEQDLDNMQQCIDLVSGAGTTVIHSFIPRWVEPGTDIAVLNFHGAVVVPEFEPRDRARDGHHYDVLTSLCLVDQLQQWL